MQVEREGAEEMRGYDQVPRGLVGLRYVVVFLVVARGAGVGERLPFRARSLLCSLCCVRLSSRPLEGDACGSLDGVARHALDLATCEVASCHIAHRSAQWLTAPSLHPDLRGHDHMHGVSRLKVVTAAKISASGSAGSQATLRTLPAQPKARTVRSRPAPRSEGTPLPVAPHYDT
jgi:hypothetical protein